jgi:hypothetical protein
MKFFPRLSKTILKRAKLEKVASQSDTTIPTTTGTDDNIVLPTEEQIAEATAPVVDVSPSAAQAADNVKKVVPVDEMTSVFDELFNEK